LTGAGLHSRQAGKGRFVVRRTLVEIAGKSAAIGGASNQRALQASDVPITALRIGTTCRRLSPEPKLHTISSRVGRADDQVLWIS